jgi:hypothetical protein
VTVDLTAIASLMLSLASAAVTAAVPILVPALLRRWHVATDTDLARRIEAAVSAGAGLAYQYGAAQVSSGGLSRVTIHDQALAAGVAYVNDRLPETLREMGCSTDTVQQMVSARLGVLLANDPSVTAGAPPPAVLPEPPLPVLRPDAPPPGRPA